LLFAFLLRITPATSKLGQKMAFVKFE